MPAPTTIDEFLELARKSGVIDEKRLAAQVEKLRASDQLPAEPVKLAQRLMADGLLTHFQAEQFLQGKWRRFTLGKYKVLERLGSGGMGSVYLCEHIMMRRRVAVKVLPPNKASDSSCLERFYREARAVAALDHPNIVRAYDIDQEENMHFLVMEHVDGSSLQEIIKKTGPMDVLRTAHYVRQAALGLQHAHETAALVHRDVKPGNILVDRNGIVKVLDMGLARFFNDEEDLLTKKYDENVLGTADYLAPEQALDSHSVDIRADVYSLGGTFYFCLTGRTPFAEGTVAQKLIWHQTRQPKPIRTLRPEVPEGIVAIVDRMMAKDVNARYQTPQEIADALEPWTQTPIPAPPEREMPQFSPAATGPRSMSASEAAGLSSSSKPSSDAAPPSPPPRKGWQVSGATATSALPAPAPAVTTAPPRPAAQPAPRPAPAPAPRVVQTPMPAGNGSARGAAAPAMELPPATAKAERAEPRPAPRPAPAPVPKPAPAEAEATDDDQEMPTLESGGAAAAAVRRKAAASREPQLARQLRPMILGSVGVLLLLLLIGLILAIGAALGWFSSRPKVEPEAQPRRIAVGPAGLRSALRGARPGDTFVLPEGGLVEHSVHVTVPDVTIEAEGKPVVWKCPDAVQPQNQVKLLHIDGVAGVTVRNITFDGAGKADALVMLYAKCPGVELKNLVLQNYARYGVLVTNCEGAEDRKVLLQGLKFPSNDAGKTAIHFTIFAKAPAFRKNRFFTIRDCAYTGPGNKITTDSGDHIDAATIDLPAADFKIVQDPNVK